MDTISAVSTSTTSGLTATTADSVAELEETYDLFLTTLLTQLETQNPLDPMDTEEMTSQLLQYSQTEQQILTNQYLENLVLATNNEAAETALSFMGKDVTYDAATQGYDGEAVSWSMEVPEGADSLTFEVFDANGLKVYETTDSSPSGSAYDFAWDGETTGTSLALAGDYSLKATANLDDGTTADIALRSSSRVTEVDWSSGVAELVLANGDVIGLDSIVSAKEPDEPIEQAA